MKLKLLSFAILLFALPAMAQKTELGLKAGVHLTQSNTSDYYQQYFDDAFGFSAGVTSNFWLNKHLFLSSGLFFDRIGSRYDDLIFTDSILFNSGQAKLIRQFDYLTLPLTVNYSFGSKNNFYIGVGGFAGYLLGAHSKIKMEDDGVDVPRRTNIRDYMEDFNFGLHFNAGYRLKVRDYTLSFSLEDRMGLNEADQNNHLKMNSFGVRVGMLIPIN